MTKIALCLTMLLTLVSQASYAGAVECYEKATMGLGLSSSQSLSVGGALYLCKGAQSTAPAECYKKAQTQLYSLSSYFVPSVSESLKLCRGSVDADETLGCYTRAVSQNLAGGQYYSLNKEQAIELCNKLP